MSKDNNYRYLIVGSSFLLMATIFSIVNSISTILLDPIVKYNDFSITQYSLLFTINAFTVAVVSPIIGNLLNKVNIKVIMSISSVMASVGYFCYGLANSIFTFYLLGIFVSIGVCGLTTIPISTMISDYFEDDKKATMMGIAFSGIGSGTFIWMQVTSEILSKYNYKMVYFILGIVMLIISLPICLFIVKRPNKIMDDVVLNNKSSSILSLSSLTKLTDNHDILFFIIGLFLMGLSFSGIKQHYQSYLSVLGYSISDNANIGSLVAIISLISNIVGGYLFDKYNIKKVLIFIGCISLISISSLFFANVPIFSYLFALCFGFTTFIISILPAFGVSKITNEVNYSSLLGFVNMFMTFGSSIGPFLSGVVFDYSSYGYTAAWGIYFIFTILYYSLFIKSIN